MTGFAEYGSYDGLGLAELVKKGEVHSAELVEEAIARAEAIDATLNPFAFKMYDRARQLVVSEIATVREEDLPQAEGSVDQMLDAAYKQFMPGAPVGG